MVAWAVLLGMPGLLPASGPARAYGVAVMLLVIVWPGLGRFPWWQLVVPPAAAMLLVKVAWGQPQLGEELARSAADLGVIVVSTTLSLAATRSLRAFDAAIAQVLRPACGRPRSLGDVQRHLYREVRRSRRTHQPLALITLRVPSEAIETRRNELIEEAFQALIPQYAQGRLARLLRREFAERAMIARLDDRLVALLPITAPDEVDRLIDRLRQSARQNLGLELSIGQALFPHQEVTLAGLLQRSAEQMHSPPTATQSVPSNGSPWRDREPTTAHPT